MTETAGNEAGQELRKAREAMGWTMQQVADVCGVTRQAVNQWETGERKPARENVVALLNCGHPLLVMAAGAYLRNGDRPTPPCADEPGAKE